MDLMDWILIGGIYVCFFGCVILDKVYRSMDDGWLEDHLQKRRENE